MGTQQIDKLIITKPYVEPGEHWKYLPETREFERVPERRKAGYIVATPGSKSFDDPGVFVELPLVNQVRPRVKEWRESGYKGATGVTRELLRHWWDREEKRFFFCQLEAIETLMWLSEAPQEKRTGVVIPSDGGPFQRVCCKLATGGGKTLVMGMLIAWQVINKVTYPTRPEFSKSVLAIAPGLTVKERLRVLVPESEGNIYDEFEMVPPGMADRLRQGRVLVQNWHKLEWETEEQLAKRRSVDKRGPLSDEAWVRDVLGDMAGSNDLIVINDEAHHAWRLPPSMQARGQRNKDVADATKWMEALDRLHRARGIRRCYDFSATPFVPIGKENTEERVYKWIVSDFGLNDAIESGLVKTPRVVIRDDAVPDAQSFRSRLYHIYRDPAVEDDLNLKAEPQEPLPDLVRQAYAILGYDWKLTKADWQKAGALMPPVMITVANLTHTAARIKFAFERGRLDPPELGDPVGLLHIDSRVLDQAEEAAEAVDLVPVVDPADESETSDGPAPRKLTKKQESELLRQRVATVGRVGKPGEPIQNVISVQMLSEGWDTKTVTHIMGLRAFDSQLLCEQVVGRGLRRTSYDVERDGRFAPEYVNVFGVPFTFLPHEGQPSGKPPVSGPKTRVEPLPDRKQFELAWPNVVRVSPVYRPHLEMDWSKVDQLHLDAGTVPMVAEMAAIIEGKPHLGSLTEIDFQKLAQGLRLQTFVYKAASEVFDQVSREWRGDRLALLSQLIGIVQDFVSSDRIRISPTMFQRDDLKRRIVLMASTNRIVQHISGAIRDAGSDHKEPVFDEQWPVGRTGDMRPWYTGRPNHHTKRSHINVCVYDSTWEASEEFELDRNEHVASWAKNDHLGFDVRYTFQGVAGKRYRPDFLVRLTGGDMLVLEVKGQRTAESQAKRQALAEWIDAVNGDGRFGKWHAGVAYEPKEVVDVLDGLAGARGTA